MQFQNADFELTALKIKHETLKETLQSRDTLLVKLHHSKKLLQKDIETLQHEIKVVHKEKLQLQKLNNELKTNLSSIIEHQQQQQRNSKQRHHQSTTQHENNMHQSRSDFSKANEILRKCAKSTSTLEPLKDCVDSLKREMETLNCIIRENNNLRTEISLMDELKMAEENGR